MNTNLYLTDVEAFEAAMKLKSEMERDGATCRLKRYCWGDGFEHVADSAAGLDEWGEYAAYVIYDSRTFNTAGVFAYGVAIPMQKDCR